MTAPRQKAEVLDQAGLDRALDPHRSRDRRAGAAAPTDSRWSASRRAARRSPSASPRRSPAIEGKRPAVGAPRHHALPGRSPASRGQPIVREHRNLPSPQGHMTIVLVDDVLFTGRTIRAAMDAIIGPRPPRVIQPGRPGRPGAPRAAHPPRLRRQEPAHQLAARPSPSCSASTTARTASSSKSRRRTRTRWPGRGRTLVSMQDIEAGRDHRHRSTRPSR